MRGPHRRTLSEKASKIKTGCWDLKNEQVISRIHIPLGEEKKVADMFYCNLGFQSSYLIFSAASKDEQILHLFIYLLVFSNHYAHEFKHILLCSQLK